MRRLLCNGTVCDGSGQEPFTGSVVINDDRIEGVLHGQGPASFDGTVEDCTGAVLSPGFIDCHSHNDWYALKSDPSYYFSPFAEQGITTQVSGNCGFSPFGFESGTNYNKLLGSGLFSANDARPEFSSFASWKHAASTGIPLNLVPLQGHGSVRIGLAGYADRDLDTEELKKHDAKLEESFDHGVFGISLGLMYEGDRYARQEELLRTAQLCRKRDGILTVHARACSAASTSYSPPFGGRPHNLRALDEMISLAERTGVRLQYSHLIFVGSSSWKTVDESLELIDKARDRGVDIAFDMYALSYGVSVITVVLPSWYLTLSPEQRSRRGTRIRLAIEIGITKRILGFGFEDIQLAWLGKESAAFCGKRVSELATEWGVTELDAYLRLLELSDYKGRVNMYRYYDEKDISRLARHPAALFMTDAWMEEQGIQNGSSYSSFPRFLALARSGEGPSMEETIRKMSGATADRFAIKQRGYLREGFFADITVFDPETIAPSADGMSRPAGIQSVYVNGRQVVLAGQVQKEALARAGCVIVR